MADSLTEQIISSAIEVHRILGPGLLESICEEALCHELSLRGFRFERQKEVDVVSFLSKLVFLETAIWTAKSI
jgi:GxxExxY protein